MTSDSSIDPNLRDAVSASRPPLEYPSLADATSNTTRLPPPPSSQPPYQQQAQQPYAPYSEDGAYQPTYYGLPPSPQYGPVPRANGFHTPAPPPSASRAAGTSLSLQPLPGHHYVSNRGGDAKRLRACEACRGLKVRCEPDPNGGACKRCLKAGRKCEITPPSRKRQKKTDSRVSELEKQLADIQSQLKMRARTAASESDAEQYDGDQNDANDEAEEHDHGDDDLTCFTATPGRQHANRPPPDARPPYQGAMAAVAAVAASTAAPLLPHTGLQMAVGQKRLHADMVQHQPVEAHMYDAPSHHHGPSINNNDNHKNNHSSLSQSHYPPSSPDASVLASVRTIAHGIDHELGVDLLTQYLRTGSPANSRSLESATVPAKFELLRRSRPVLFVAIMVVMLQARCRGGGDEDGDEGAAPAAGSNGDKSEVSLKDHQALHVLSEAATMGKSGRVGAGDDGQGEPSTDVDMHDPRPSNPAHALMERLRRLNEKDMEKDTWFEEALQGFQ